MLAPQGGFGEFLNGKAQRFGKGFDKGPATGRAGLIEENALDVALSDLHAFDVLPADVQNETDAGQRVIGRFKVGHGFHFFNVKAEGDAKHGRPVAGDRALANVGVLGQAAQNFQNHLAGRA